jgi:hypothetical protein
MTPRLRKLAFTAHVTSSVGWLGAVVVFLALSVIGLTSQDAQTVRGVYLVMAPGAWFALVPLAFTSLLTGIVQSLGTPWGLFRHYWVIFKLVIAVFVTIVLLIYMQTFSAMARLAASPSTDLGAVRNPSPMIHALLALLSLVVAVVLAVYKPQGMTRYGIRRDQELPGDISGARDSASTGTPRWARVFGVIAIAVVLLFLLLLFTRGLHHDVGHHTRLLAAPDTTPAALYIR